MSSSAPQDEVPTTRLPAPAPAPDLLESRRRKRALLEELSQSWAAGAPVRPEDLLARWPGDPQGDPDVASLVFEEWRRKRAQGQEPSREDLERRFPEQRDSLRSLLHQHDLLHSLGGSCPSDFSLALPNLGDEVFGFRLRQELGRGAFARVFLGQQAQLAGRPVVLKISRAESSEPQTLAQLQHTNIVPIYSLHEDVQAGLRLVCMPYFGGASLAEVLRKLRAEEKQPQQGAQLAAALERAQVPLRFAPEDSAHERSGAEGSQERSAEPTVPEVSDAPPAACCIRDSSPLQRPWQRLTYVQAAVWIVARIADALEHAHERGILHRDVKPSNILLAADGEPLLLDFNLAQKIEDRARAALGGTVAYMAPEHLRAMAARNPVVSRSVDRRADIYSLGMVLYEMLVGERPFEQSASYSPMPALIEAMAVERSAGTPSVRQHRPEVPWSLESIVRHCLAPDPDKRYRHARHLGEDLRAFLDDMPLRHAPELSRVERVQKWVRRHPRLASSGSVAALAAGLLLTAAVAFAGLHQHLRAAQEGLSDADARQRQREFDAGAVRALCWVNTRADWGNQDHLQRGIDACEQTLELYEVLSRPDWQERNLWRRFVTDERRETTRELLLLLARARVQKMPDDRATLGRALELLDKAEAIAGVPPTPALWEDRADFLGQLGKTEEAAAARDRARKLPPATARDFYLLACTHVRRDGPTSADAYAALQQAIQRQPKHYWAYLQRGAIHLERGDYTLAARDFGICKGLWPEFAPAYFNLGVLHLRQWEREQEITQFEDAVAEFTAAIERDPEFLMAYGSRGLAYLQGKRYAEALADFQHVADQGREDAITCSGRAVALEGLKRHAEADRAFAEAQRLAQIENRPLQLRLRSTEAFAVAERLPARAQQLFAEILDEVPEHRQALYGMGMLAAKGKRLEAAVDYFDQALAADPNFFEARRFRGVLQARRGRLAEAVADINWCLERQPKSGATLYAAACVASLTLERSQEAAGKETLDQAALCLERALQRGYGRDQAGADPDLAALRRFPVFERIMNSEHSR